MAKTKISEFSATPANNTDIDSINIAEGCAPSGINDAIRELMAQLKDFQTGAVGDSFNGPVGTTTAAAGAFTTLSASSTVSGTGFSTYLASPPAIGGTAAAAGSFTTLSASGNVTLSGGTANGVAYLNGSKVVTSGSALTFDGTTLNNSGAFGTSTAALTLKNSSAANSSNIVEQQFFASNSFSGLDTIAKFGALNPSAGGNNYGTFYWSLANAGSPSEQMRLTSTGLGIGTSSPNGTLQLSRNASSGNWLVLDDTRSGYGDWAFYKVGANDLTIGYDTTAGSAPTQALTISYGGNLGLGVTPSAWRSEFKVLQLNARTSIFGSADSTFLSTNEYIDSAGTARYIQTGSATRYRQDDRSHIWSYAASGTAGNAITFSQAMTLDASGNLAIGTTSAGDRLTVSGGRIRMDQDYQIVWQNAGTNRARIYGDSGNNLLFENGSGNTERARISSSGNYMVATTSVGGTISCARNGNTYNYYATSDANNTTEGFFLGYSSGASANRIIIYSNGNVVNANNSYGALSDSKLKENIVDATPKLAGLMQVKVRNYNLIGETTKQLGVVAQELETVFPAMVDESPDKDAEGNDLGTTTKSVKYSVFVPMLIKAIQELKAEFDAYKASHP